MGNETESQLPMAAVAAEPPPIPLRLLAAGQSACIDQVVGSADQVHRIHELGLRAGTRIELIQSGSPCIVRLRDHTLCIRGSETLSVLVRPEGPS